MKSEQRQLPSYPLRLEPETRAKLEAIAKANGRSLHAEISMRLDASLQAEETAPLVKNLSMQLPENFEIFKEISKINEKIQGLTVLQEQMKEFTALSEKMKEITKNFPKVGKSG